MEHELTFYHPACIVRGVTGNTVKGTAITYFDGTPGSECQPYGDGTYERLQPGCFDDCLTRGHDVIATFDHKQSNLLGRTPATLRLVPTRTGIEAELDLPDTQLGRDVGKLIERGDIRGFSFVARPGKSKFSKEGDRNVLTIERFKALHEVSLVVFPYYTGAQIKRGQDFHSEQYDAWQEVENTSRMIERIRGLSL